MKRPCTRAAFGCCRRRRRRRHRAGQVSVEAGEDRRALCAGRRDRHHLAAVRRAVQEQLGQSFVVENKAGAFGIIGIEEMARSKPDGYTLFVGNVSTNAITPVLFQKKFQINFEKDVVLGVAACDLSVVPDHDDDGLRREERRGADRLRQEESGKVRYSARASAASRTSTWRSSRGAQASTCSTSRTRPAQPAWSTISWSATRRWRCSTPRARQR